MVQKRSRDETVEHTSGRRGSVRPLSEPLDQVTGTHLPLSARGRMARGWAIYSQTPTGGGWPTVGCRRTRHSGRQRGSRSTKLCVVVREWKGKEMS